MAVVEQGGVPVLDGATVYVDTLDMRGFNDNHSTSINWKGQPTKKDYKALAEKFSVKNWEAMLNKIRSILGK